MITIVLICLVAVMVLGISATRTPRLLARGVCTKRKQLGDFYSYSPKNQTEDVLYLIEYEHLFVQPLSDFLVSPLYVEEVAFADYQAAIHGYFQLSGDLFDSGEVLENQYDFFDFYSVVLRFPEHTLRLVRIVDKVRVK